MSVLIALTAEKSIVGSAAFKLCGSWPHLTLLLIPAEKQEVGNGENTEPPSEAHKVVIHPGGHGLVVSNHPGHSCNNPNNHQSKSILLPDRQFSKVYFYARHGWDAYADQKIVKIRSRDISAAPQMLIRVSTSIEH